MSDLEISPVALQAALGRRSVRVVDVREPAEWATGHLAGATLVPLGTLPQRLGELSPDDDIVLVCRAGVRSLQALQLLQGHGFRRLQSLAGGLIAWRRELGEAGLTA